MSIRETFAPANAQPAELFTALTAEAWLDPQLAGRLAADKAETIRAFARDLGYEVPTDEEIRQFEIAPNPVGDLDLSVNEVRMDSTTDGSPSCDYYCSTGGTGCNSNNGTCPSPSYNCVTSVACSFDCSWHCSHGCFTTLCSAECQTSRCSVGCGP
jgi:hypothetical protein